MQNEFDFVDSDLVSQVFSGETKDQAIHLFEDMNGKIAGRMQDAIRAEFTRYGLTPKKRQLNKGQQRVRYLKSIFDNHGVDPNTGVAWSFKDMQAIDKQLMSKIADGSVKREDFMDTQWHGDQPMLTPQVVSMKVREAIEPMLMLTPLMQRINFSGPQLSFPAVSSMMAGDLRIPEGGEYPEGRIQFGATQVAKIGKHGIKLSMTEEMIRYSQWDVWSMNLRAAGRALAKHKENQVVDQIFAQGTNYFDNGTVSGRKTTGRDINGNFNATFTIDDLYDMYSDLSLDGFIPDLIIMHPFAWPIFARDPIMRNLAYMHGGGGVVGNAYQGSPNGTGFSHDLGGLGQERRFDEPANVATTFSPVPAAFPYGSLRMIITPFCPFDRATSKTDIYLCDSRDLGALVVDEDVVTVEWNDPEHDIKSIKLRERYGLAKTNQGRSIRIAKDVVVDKAYDFSLSTLQASVTLNTSEVVV